MMQKHIGRLSHTDQRVVVVYMLIPKTTDRSLVVEIDALPERLSQVVRDLLESSEGQGARDLAEVLGRRMFEDSGKSVLQALHESGKLNWVPIDSVTMYPMPNQPFPLRALLQQMGVSVASTPQIDDGSQGKHNQFAENRRVEVSQDVMGQARGLLEHASILQQEADLKRAQAYRLAPSLAPAPVSPAPAALAPAPVTQDTKASVRTTTRTKRATKKAVA